MTRSLCVAMAVDIDRFSDAYIRKSYDGVLRREDGTKVRWYEIRALCAEYRAKGFKVFPPCGNVDERGFCQGHEEPDDKP